LYVNNIVWRSESGKSGLKPQAAREIIRQRRVRSARLKPTKGKTLPLAEPITNVLPWVSN